MARHTITDGCAGTKPRIAQRFQALAACVLLAVATVACSTSHDSVSDPSLPIHITAEKDFALQLESNASTGFAWRLSQPLDPKTVVLLGSSYAQTGASKPGAGGVETWRFRTVATGQTSISLEYVRPWEEGAAPARTAVFALIVE